MRGRRFDVACRIAVATVVELLEQVAVRAFVTGANRVVAAVGGLPCAVQRSVPEHAFKITRRRDRTVVMHRSEFDRIVDDEFAQILGDLAGDLDARRKPSQQLLAPA